MKKKKNRISDPELSLQSLLDRITPEQQEKIDYRMKLAAKISSALKRKKWTQTKFAEEMGKKQVSIINRWLSGTHNFESDTLFDIQTILGVKLLDIEIKNESLLYTFDSMQKITINFFPIKGSILKPEIFDFNNTIQSGQSMVQIIETAPPEKN